MKNQSRKTKLAERIVRSGGEVVKIGIDLHARQAVLVVQVDGSVPMRALKMKPGEVGVLVSELLRGGLEVHACYEAGPCGYGLYRQLKQLGAECYVVAPVKLSDGRQQKTDSLDARALTERLDRYASGNKKAFSAVRVPSMQEEERRSQYRYREQLKKSVQQWASRGKSLLLSQGYVVSGKWWGPRKWVQLREALPKWLEEQLEQMREILLQMDKQQQACKRAIEESVKKPIPLGVGKLSWAVIESEVCDWNRFNNRREVSSYTGLCPGIHQSGGSARTLSINRQGNARLRGMLVEMVWRLLRWQPDYPGVRKLQQGMVKGAARKKLVVAAARQLAVDLWRLATGQSTPEKLGLLLALPPG
jgi:transposase